MFWEIKIKQGFWPGYHIHTAYSSKENGANTPPAVGENTDHPKTSLTGKRQIVENDVNTLFCEANNLFQQWQNANLCYRLMSSGLK